MRDSPALDGAKHTQGLLRLNMQYADIEIRGPEESGVLIAVMSPWGEAADTPTPQAANARRLVACWNACLGVPIEVLEAQQSGGLPWSVADQLDARKALTIAAVQRARLLHELRALLKVVHATDLENQDERPTEEEYLAAVASADALVASLAGVAA